ncbi:MAG: GntR family transcriptional regulator [Boseongicola sp. SB0667_bin_21]|nr:GntR family transcriptional regulator [Boseongicola sp. SB0667_bin_21]
MGASAAPARSRRAGRSLPDRVDEAYIVERILSAVMEHRLPPAQKLSELKLCEAFGVGRMRVRRALLLLSDQGIVELESNRGAFVASPSRTEANEIFDARSVLEPAIAKQVAAEISGANLAMLKQHVLLEDEARESGKGADLIRLSGEFHVKLALASGNSVLRRVVRELVTRSSLIVGLYGTSNRTVCPDHEHSDMLGEIERGNSDAAAAQMFEHLIGIRAGLDLSTTRPEEGDLKGILGLT